MNANDFTRGSTDDIQEATKLRRIIDKKDERIAALEKELKEAKVLLADILEAHKLSTVDWEAMQKVERIPNK